MRKILVYGFYNKGSIGDELFVDAFKQLFNYELIFIDRFTIKNLQQVDSVFIGGGSFLYSNLIIDADAIDILKQKKIFYIGVGPETKIHPIHIGLLSIAKLVAIRSSVNIDYIKTLNNNVIVMPDLVYYLQPHIQKKIPNNKTILFLPNIHVVPQNNDPQWKFAAWNYFKSEFSQFLDSLVDAGYSIETFAMCQNSKDNDYWAGTEIMNQMNKRKDNFFKFMVRDITTLSSIMSKYETIITQRFHGIVLSEMTKTPYLAICHHDKLKYHSPSNGIFLSFYGINKETLMRGFEQTKKIKFEQKIDLKIFNKLQNSISKLIEEE